MNRSASASRHGLRRAGEMLPYAQHLDANTLSTKGGAVLQILHLKGLPFETADVDEINYRKQARDAIFRSIAHSRLTLYQHVIRRRVAAACDGQFEAPFARALDTWWRRRLSAQRLHVNDLFLSLLLRPPVSTGLRRSRPDPAARVRAIRELDAIRNALLAAFEPYGARVLSRYQHDDVVYSEPLEFLSCLFGGVMRPISTRGGDVNAGIAWRRVSFGPDTIELGANEDTARSFAAILSLKEYPAATSPGQLDPLLRLPVELVVSQSFVFLDRQSALSRMDLALRRLRAADDDALTLRNGLVAAKDDTASGRTAFGEHHLTVAVRADTPAELDHSVAAAQAALAEAGMLAVRETVAMEPAFWAQFPGASDFVPRRAQISSANFASLASCHNQPSGAAAGNHWGPAVTVLETTAASPYYFNFHHGDLGNFLLIGPSGAGKTVILNFLLAQADRFRPRIVLFDKDRGAEIFLRALGGRYEVLRPGVRSGLNPLQLSDSPANRRFLREWTASLLGAAEATLASDDRNMIAMAVAANFDQPQDLRQLRFFRELFAGARRPVSGDLPSRLAKWADAGDCAWLFDNERDDLDLSCRIVGFDITQLLDDPVTRTPALMYLFHRVEERLDGTPTIIVVDEGWKALDDDVFLARIRDWEKTIRKRNGVLGFATQSAADAIDSAISSAIIEQSATQIFLPNPKAQESDYCDGFGLSPYELHLIRTLPDTSRCFLVKQGSESVVARLDLTGARQLLTILSGREQSIRRLDSLRAELGDDPARWLPALVKAPP